MLLDCRCIQLNSNCDYRGIPLELLQEKEDMEAATYDTALRELQLLDDHYRNALETLHHQYQDYIGSRDGGWSTGDAERFQHIVSQYPTSLVRRRTLLIDRLMRELPHKTRAEIVSGSYNCFIHR